MSPPTTFADAWAAWLAYRCCSARPLRASTLADYESIYRRHLGPALAGVSLVAIDGTAIASVVVALSRSGIQPKRLSNVLVPLRACLRWHHRMGSLSRDPSPWFDSSVPAADERRILSLADLERLIAEIPPQYRAFVATAAYTGMRLGEIRALTWSDIDFGTRLARVNKTYYRTRMQRSTKTGHDREVPLPAHIVDVLLAWRPRCPPSADDLVFPQPSGRPIDPDDFRRRVFKPACARAGVPPGTRFHDLRHTCASLYLASGATVREVMDIHGWRQMQTAMRYLHTTDSLTTAADRLSAARARVELSGAASRQVTGNSTETPHADDLRCL
ncbi:MAG: site-specific integrase [Coriobacteriales bacterium]|nr:site-specific integrase [Coriobacteriales bacterium]